MRSHPGRGRGFTFRRTCLAITLGFSASGAALAVTPGREASVETVSSARVVASADPRVLQEARVLLAAKRAEDAYQLLAPHEYQWAGDRDFDYLLGAAAVDSGRPSEAVMALQRAVATDPQYSAARMELARAYYDLGDYDYSKSEFAQLLSEEPPDYARRVIDNYLLTIDKKTSSYRAGFQYFFEVDGGYDSNANGSTSDDTFLGFTLADRNVETDSFFVGFAHGAIWNNPLTPRLTHYNQIGTGHRRNVSASFINSDRLSGASSLVWRDGGTTLNGGLGAYLTYLDSDTAPFSGDQNQHGLLLDLGARQLLGDRWLIGGDLREGLVRYEDNLDIRDVDQTIYALTVEHFQPGARQARYGLTLIGGKEKAKQSNSPFGRDQSGLRLTTSWLYSPTARNYLYAGSLKSDYTDPFFGAVENREDRQSTFGWYVIWRVFPTPNWALVPRLTFVDNKSNVELFDYDRAELGLALRFVTD